MCLWTQWICVKKHWNCTILQKIGNEDIVFLSQKASQPLGKIMIDWCTSESFQSPLLINQRTTVMRHFKGYTLWVCLSFCLHTCPEHMCTCARLAQGAAHLQGIHTSLLLYETGGLSWRRKLMCIHKDAPLGSAILISAQWSQWKASLS